MRFKLNTMCEISIHAPRAGSDLLTPAAASCAGFQSTLPVRGATVYAIHCITICDISIHAPRAGSDLEFENAKVMGMISIHAPRAGSDGADSDILIDVIISIHAPRAGSDSNILCFCKFKAQYILNQLF